MVGSCFLAAIKLHGIIPSLFSNIYPLINPLLAPGYPSPVGYVLIITLLAV